jgi:hypothetical protein
MTTTVVGFAYETDPDTEIVTGQTGVPDACAPPYYGPDYSHLHACGRLHGVVVGDRIRPSQMG